MSPTRRNLFIASGAALAIAVGSSQATPRARAAGSGSTGAPTITPVGTSKTMFGPGFMTSEEYLDVVGFRISGLDAALPTPLLEVRFDPRVVEDLGSGALATRSGVTEIGSRRSNMSKDTARLLLSINATDSADDALFIALPLRCRQLFPHEDVEAPRPTTARLVDPSTNATLATSPRHRRNSHAVDGVWGAELAAMWTDVSAAALGNDTYAIPRICRVDSTGPGPIPRGSTVQVEWDSRLATLGEAHVFDGDDETNALPVTVTEAAPGRRHYSLEWPIPAGQAVSLRFDGAAARTRLAPASVRFSKLAIHGPESSLPRQRSTGIESVSALSRSAHPRSHRAFVGTI